MAEVRLLVCDACTDQQTPATETFRLTLADQPLRVDACPEHAAEFRQVLDRLAEVGQPEVALPNGQRAPGRRAPSKTKVELLRSPGSRGCPICFGLFSTQGNMGHHVRSQHSRKPDEFDAETREAATAEARRRVAAELEEARRNG